VTTTTTTAPRCELYAGDCLEAMRKMETGSVDAVITDPPYSSGGFVRGDRMSSTRAKYCQTSAEHTLANFSGDNRDQRGYLAWCTQWMSEARRLTKPGGMLCCFTDWRQLPITTDAVQCAGWVWRGIGVWAKANARPCKGRYNALAEFVVWATNGPRPLEGPVARGLWTGDTPRGASRRHITQKPVGVMREILKPFAPPATILDPFAGSGTTAVACQLEGLEFIGIELDPENLTIIRERIAAGK
jgi:site-specific DNA-methyltransferase (adenine-specific)